MLGPIRRRLAAMAFASAIAILAGTGQSHAGDAELARAIELASRGDVSGVNGMRSQLDVVEAKIADWLIIRLGTPEISSQSITQFALANPHWPDPEMFRRRAEQALEREKPPADIIIQAFQGSRPYSNRGRMMLARALLEKGRTQDAAAWIRLAWRDESLSEQDEAAIMAEFGSLLPASEHRARLELALLKGRSSDAVRIARRMNPAYQKLAAARLAVERKAGNAGKLLDQVPSEIKNETAYLFGRAQWARRSERWQEAAELLLRAPRDPKQMVVPDEWWEEKRIVSRKILDAGDPKTAYRIVAGHTGSSPAVQADADFHTGWLALRYLKEPRTAMSYFARVAEASSKPVTQARAYYWLGRASEAGAGGTARDYYAKAAQYGFTFYGQLARAKLGMADLGLQRTIVPSGADKAAAERDDRFAALIKLQRVGRKDLAAAFYRHLADTLPTPGQVAILINIAEGQGWVNYAVMAGKAAAQRGLDMEVLAFPLKGLPADIDTSGLEKALAFSITRQESEFNQSVVSSAGATGIFQVMPVTGREAAKKLGIGFDANMWRNDVRYNVRLGAAYVNNLVQNYDGNYVMAIAGYNAGPGRIREWVQAYGDPRDPAVDPIDWMERIPFSETRNYVHRVLENLQVYRFRMEGQRLQIADDLRRGVGARGATVTGSIGAAATGN
ncbi:lytic transglycosylase domain-containing protein [Prosthecomicrobium hirschii]|uniref:lytic transglycosylase domain-containing protein n=2 Tax=Prosthecodimorpha hirschii TaxID=665126 RepID=UPI002220B251|nr:lytic transglycosylase domain-containing protein [Prosthecomicrobium hirschii]MCW1840179.1 lytic transglycosylase domain-containing protein [Prosthecomicrobium hirschii]